MNQKKEAIIGVFRSPMNEARDPGQLPACEKNNEQEKLGLFVKQFLNELRSN